MIAEWRGYIQKRNNGSEMVNYDDPNFPSYVHNGYVDPGSSWANDPHFHDDVELLHVTKGYMAYNINGHEILLNEGDTIFVNARQVHFSVPKREERTYYTISIFHPRVLCSTSGIESKYIRPVTENNALPFIRFKKDDQYGIGIAKKLSDISKIKNNDFKLTQRYFDIWEDIFEKAKTFEKDTTIKYSQTQVESLKSMLNFIQKNYYSAISLDDIAAAGNVSRTFCNSLFHKYADQTPIESLTRFRVSKVAELLSSTPLSMSEIAFNTGFSSASYMAEAFKKYYGESPRSFRNHLDQRISK